MAENLFTSFKISGQGMSVQRQRLSAIARNIANVSTTKGPDGKPYQRETVVTNFVSSSPFGNILADQISLRRSDTGHSHQIGSGLNNSDGIFLTAETVQDNSEPRMVYDPNHPDTDENGYVLMPNINIVTEMVEMISAQRAFEANVGVVEAAKNIARDSLEI